MPGISPTGVEAVTADALNRASIATQESGSDLHGTSGSESSRTALSLFFGVGNGITSKMKTDKGVAYSVTANADNVVRQTGQTRFASGFGNIKLHRRRLRPGRHAMTNQVPKTSDSQTLVCENVKTIVTVLLADRTRRRYFGTDEFMADYHFYKSIVASQQFLWVDVLQPDPQILNVMEEIFCVHPLTSEDILGPVTREKVEMYDGYMFVVIQAPAPENSDWRPESYNIDVCLYEKMVLTFHDRISTSIDDALAAMDREKRLTPDWVLYLIVDSTTDLFVPDVSAMEREVDAIDELVFVLGESDQTDALRRMDNACRQLAGITQLLKPKRDCIAILAGTCRAGPRHIQHETILYLRDTLDMANHLMNKIESSRSVINSTQASYISQINARLSENQHLSTAAVGKLALASVIFMPLTLLAGIFGQNVPVPFQTSEEKPPNLGAFCVICTINVIIALILCIWAKRAQLI